MVPTTGRCAHDCGDSRNRKPMNTRGSASPESRGPAARARDATSRDRSCVVLHRAGTRASSKTRWPRKWLHFLSILSIRRSPFPFAGRCVGLAHWFGEARTTVRADPCPGGKPELRRWSLECWLGRYDWTRGEKDAALTRRRSSGRNPGEAWGEAETRLTPLSSFKRNCPPFPRKGALTVFAWQMPFYDAAGVP